MNKSISGADLYKMGIDYYDHGPIYIEGRKVYGMAYKLCKPLTDEQKAKLSEYRAVVFAKAKSQYAPELVRNVVIIKTLAQMKRENQS